MTCLIRIWLRKLTQTTFSKSNVQKTRFLNSFSRLLWILVTGAKKGLNCSMPLLIEVGYSFWRNLELCEANEIPCCFFCALALFGFAFLPSERSPLGYAKTLLENRFFFTFDLENVICANCHGHTRVQHVRIRKYLYVISTKSGVLAFRKFILK